MDLVPLPFRARLQQVRQIVFVHGEYQVEGLEIRRGDLSRPLQGDIDTMPSRHGDGSRIGCVTRVPAAGAGGIDGKPIRHGRAVGKVSQNPFGKR
ncbi:hypothetical protein BCY90_07815 [Agrobacterium deltaense]|nr:hypothetical protein L901_08155 [Agrobacterium sp. D14]RKF33731.1 hypothetical protein BCY90_07815 [Agrobacterium deltaense]